MTELVITDKKPSTAPPYARASRAHYFRFKALWLDETTVSLHVAVPGRAVLGDRASESRSWVTMVDHGMVAALSRRS